MKWRRNYIFNHQPLPSLCPYFSPSTLLHNPDWDYTKCLYLPTPFIRAGYDTRSVFYAEFNRFWIQSFLSPRPVATPRLKSLICSIILPMTERRIVRFIPFLKILALCEMTTASSSIWILVAVSISYNDNHNTTSTSSFFTNPSAWAGWDTRSILKKSLTGLNSKVFFSKTVCHTKVKAQSALLFTHSWKENKSIHTFPKGIHAIWNVNSLIQDLNLCRCVHFLWP